MQMTNAKYFIIHFFGLLTPQASKSADLDKKPYPNSIEHNLNYYSKVNINKHKTQFKLCGVSSPKRRILTRLTRIITEVVLCPGLYIK